MRVGVVGINHKLADLQLRELLAKVCQRRFGQGQSIHHDQTFILLSTCNRTEVYFYSDDLSATHIYLLNILRQEVQEEFDQKLYSYFGQDCFLHLSRVTTGLDSAIVAETEIQGQVKAAYETATKCTKLPFELHYLFQKSLQIGKRARSTLNMEKRMPGLEHALLNIGTHFFNCTKKAKILFVGASDINYKILCFFKEKEIHNITLCNRSAKPIESIASTHQLQILDWRSISTWHDYDWIIFGTKSPDFLLSKNDLPHEFMSHKLVIDLCVPRNVDPHIGRHPHITLLNIDQINRTLKIRKQRMNQTLIQAENIVANASKRHIDIFQEKEKNRLRILAVGA